MTAYLYKANCIALNLAVGDALAGAIGITPEDATTFSVHGTRLYAPGTTFTNTGPLGSPVASAAPVAWFAAPLLTEREYELVQEFLSDGPYPGLNACGVSDAVIAAAKPAMVIEVGERAATEANWRQHIADAGYITP